MPEEEIHLYAVCSRFPHILANLADWRPVQAGVYECRRGTDAIRVVVLGELPQTANNAPLHLLSANPELVEFGASHYEQRSPNTSTLIHQLFEGFKREGIAMPYTMQDFRHDFAKEHIREMLDALSPEERHRVFSDVPPEERLAGLSPEDVLRALSPEAIEKYLKRRKQEPRSRKRKKNG